MGAAFLLPERRPLRAVIQWEEMTGRCLMDIEAIAEEWKAKGRLAEMPALAEPVRGGPEEVRMELYVMRVHVLRLHMAGRVLDLPAEWFVPAYEGAAAFLWMLEAGAPGVRADLSDGSFRAEWTLRRTGTDGLGVFSVKYPDFQRAEAAVRVEDFIAEGKAALQAFLSEDIIHDEGRCYFAAYQAEPLTTADAWSAAAALAVWNDLRSARWLFPSPQAPLAAEEWFGAAGAEALSRKMQGPPDRGWLRENPCRPAAALAAALHEAGALREEAPLPEEEGPIEAVTVRASVGAEETGMAVEAGLLSGASYRTVLDPASDDAYRLLLWAYEIGEGRDVSARLSGGAVWRFRGFGGTGDGLWEIEDADGGLRLRTGRASFSAAWRTELRRFFSGEALLREGVRSVQDDAGRILYGARSGEEQAEARRHLTETLAAWNACRGADWLFPLPLAALSPKDFLNAAARQAAGV